MNQIAESTLATVRRVSAELRPGILDALGLPAAVDWLVRDFEKRSEIPCSLLIEPEEIEVEQNLATDVFRVLQEALTNVARHARASSLQVTLRQTEGMLELEVADDGIGISEEEISRPGSLGLLGIRERLMAHGGDITLRRLPGQGTCLSAAIPTQRQGGLEMINVIIADDHPVVRAGIKQILLEAGDVLAVAETGSGEELIREVRSHDFDVVLLDITMPGIGGLETLKRLKALKPELPVLMLSVHSEDQFALRTMKAGAAGYLTKESAPAELVKAIRQVVGGRSYISPEFAEKLATELHQDFNHLPHERLSDREMQVLCMMAAGKTASGIAAALNLSVKTVSTYRARIIEKTGMATNAELIAYAVKNNLC